MTEEILYEDDTCLVINKPAGIEVAEIESSTRLLAHRLDKPTTGCLLLAKSAEALAFLQKQFKNREIEKTYLALVTGVPLQHKATIDSPIGRSVTNRTKMSIFRTSKSREAQTSYRLISSDLSRNISLLQCHPLTGRTHQIRVHLSSIGHPVLGDTTYNSSLAEYPLMLHAWKLRFESPADNKKHEIIAPLSPTFEQTLKKLEISFS